ncbi:hypothetical protein [Aquirufa regiilacus]|uniref:Uncharacterized protein n=1 Tax=Aquirufa regiilacus TaxID=3024868 RepID=A0ABU3TT07_9BACT|nr:MULTISPECIES: hypothetical protein [unclassified Aquirufa]MDT8887808.1 hypothetical protein [Aquirufa sp. LEPPI-3A]MDU0808982.1 hypothetical protein [Aquirufa sp. LEOWEIH-7C]
MKTSEDTIKGYDCVKSVRRIRAKINKELEGLSNEQILQHYREASKKFQEKMEKLK